MAGEVVAWFEARDGEGHCGKLQLSARDHRLTPAEGNIEICENEQFHLGRDTELW